MSRALHTWVIAIVVALTGATATGDPKLPPEGKLAKINGAHIYYEGHGKGDPLLLLHKFGGTSDDYKPFITELAKTYRVIAVDLRGHGRSTNPSATFTSKQAAKDVIALMDQLGFKQVRAIGMSIGAIALLQVATTHPSRVKAMVLVGGAPYYSKQMRAILSDPKCTELSADEMKEERKKHLHSDAQVIAIQKQFCALKDSYDDATFTPPQLATISARTLIVHGDRDRWFPVEMALELYRAIPNAALWVHPFGAHTPPLKPENHAEFLRTTQEFLRDDVPKKP